MKDFGIELERLKNEGLIRQLPQANSGIDFISNDYLGLANKTASIEDRNGSTGSRLLSGNSRNIEQLEEDFAAYYGSEAALLFSSGYQCNLGVLSCIAGRNDALILDELCHASLIDGARLSHASKFNFRHNDLTSLSKKLMHSKGTKMVVVEGLYSMEGSIPDIESIHKRCEENDALLIIDEAHSIGVLGEQGKGISDRLKNARNCIRILTFGKAFGVHGAVVLCSGEIRDYLINFSRPFIYTTAPSPHAISVLRLAFENVKRAAQARSDLQDIIDYWNRYKPEHLNWLASNTAIQPLIIPGNENVIRQANYLAELGFRVLPIRSPSVPKGKERIRFTLHAFNTQKEIDVLFKELMLWN